MTRTTAWVVAVVAFTAGLLNSLGLVLRAYGPLGAEFSILAFALTLTVFSMLATAARGLPGTGFLTAGFICGVANFLLAYLAPFFGQGELVSTIGTVSWPIALVLVAVGLSQSRLVPSSIAWLAGAWGLLVALRAVAMLGVPPRLPSAETALIVLPAVVGALFLVALGVGVLARSKEAQ